MAYQCALQDEHHARQYSFAVRTVGQWLKTVWIITKGVSAALNAAKYATLVYRLDHDAKPTYLESGRET